MRALVLGSGGLLGSYIYRYGRKNGIDMVGLSRGESEFVDIRGDATDFGWLAREVERAKCDIVINALKFKGSTDACESDREGCWKANFMVPQRLSAIQKKLGFGLVQVSTDWVFDGTKGQKYSEDDVPYPRNFYAFSKHAAELAVSGCSKYMVLRTTGLFGYEKPARNFLARFLESAKAGNRFEGATDQVSQPISALGLSKIIFGLVNRGEWNRIYHATGPDLVSRYELALIFAAHYGHGKDSVGPTTSASRAIFIPKNVAMDIGRAEKALGRKIEHLGQMLDELDAFENPC